MKRIELAFTCDWSNPPRPWPRKAKMQIALALFRSCGFSLSRSCENEIWGSCGLCFIFFLLFNIAYAILKVRNWGFFLTKCMLSHGKCIPLVLASIIPWMIMLPFNDGVFISIRDFKGICVDFSVLFLKLDNFWNWTIFEIGQFLKLVLLQLLH